MSFFLDSTNCQAKIRFVLRLHTILGYKVKNFICINNFWGNFFFYLVGKVNLDLINLDPQWIIFHPYVIRHFTSWQLRKCFLLIHHEILHLSLISAGYLRIYADLCNIIVKYLSDPRAGVYVYSTQFPDENQPLENRAKTSAFHRVKRGKKKG